MNKFLKYILFPTAAVFLFVFSCKDKDRSVEHLDGIVQGKIDILVDETFLPIIADQVQVFENVYDAKITLLPKSENEALVALSQGKAKVIVLSRKLNVAEEVMFKNRKLIPKVTEIGKDAIALIKSKSDNDTLVNLQDVLNFMKGEKNGIKGLVFDNPNSSTIRYFNTLAGLKETPKVGIFSFGTNNEVIKYVSENKGMIGIVGMNWLTQPTQIMQDYVNKVAVLSVKSNSNEYVYPSQDNIAMNKYPLARDLYIINCQGYEGLGIGFSSFVAGERGQRIILKSGLLPIRLPGRKIVTRKNI